MAKLEILYFAWVREAIGKDGETIDHPGSDTTVADVITLLKDRGEGYAEAFGDTDKVRAALDHAFVTPTTPLGEAHELALFPPVTGG